MRAGPATAFVTRLRILPQGPPGNRRLRRDFDRLQPTINDWITELELAA